MRRLLTSSIARDEGNGSVVITHLFVCYFVFDWWGVSTAIKIRLCAGLLSLLPLKGCGMSLHVHRVVTENG